MALARVHTRLARNARDDAASVDTQDFVGGLGADLQAAQTGEGLRPVALSVAAESHTLDAERAVQVGLVLNEAITNALKYGFPDERAGTVRVTFVRDGAEFVLTVADDGVGLSEDDSAEGRTPSSPRGTGIGTRLLRALAAQLRGSFSRRLGEDGVGTIAELRFPADPLSPSR
jgi:two-component sensor histidine kinase